MSKNRVLAVGLGFKESSKIDYVKTFTQDKNNHGAVEDFLNIVAEELGYGSGNSIITLENVDLSNLADIFTKANHGGSADFINQAKERDGAFICIMVEETSQNSEEVQLIGELRSNGKLTQAK